jgi:hypothetical protein
MSSGARADSIQPHATTDPNCTYRSSVKVPTRSAGRLSTSDFGLLGYFKVPSCVDRGRWKEHTNGIWDGTVGGHSPSPLSSRLHVATGGLLCDDFMGRRPFMTHLE